MKGDFTRLTFRPKKHYSGVRMQQGRVQLDADWNEQVDIAAHRVETESGDILGRYAVPMEDPGFKITVADKEGALPSIGKGRLYLDGILVENDKDMLITEQNEFLPRNSLPKTDEKYLPGEYLAYLDVWQRHVTALEDDQIREIALGGPDTATRTQMVWQVRLLGPLTLKPENGPLTCLSEPDDWENIVDFPIGRLQARTAPGTTPANLCEVPAGAGYRRLENQLYRVEIHTPGKRGKATFKWSRDNGSIVTAWTGQDRNNLIVKSIGRDQVLGFAAGQTVELTDDYRELRGKSGVLVKLSNAEGQVLTLDPDSPTVKLGDFVLNPKVRRWDSNGEVQTSRNWIPLEDGVEVFFDDDCEYKTGDYWMIPARTAKGDIEWPADETNPNLPAAVSRQGIEHHYCRLATLQYDGTNFNVTGDCRPIFPQLTMLTSLYYVGGDGQEAMPGQRLPHALRVRVANGQLPVINAKVRFTILLGGGSIKGLLEGEPSISATISTTSADGVAECEWTLGPSGNQQVKAQLWDAAEHLVSGQVILFNANLSIAEQVAYKPTTDCPDLSHVTTVQAAIDALCRRPAGGGCCIPVFKENQNEDYRTLDIAILSLIKRGLKEIKERSLKEKKIDICLCLMPGDHELPEVVELNEFLKKFEYDFQQGNVKADIHVKITGCGSGTRLYIDQAPLSLIRLASFTFRDMEINISIKPSEISEGAISFVNCGRVTLDSCYVSGLLEKSSLVSIRGVKHFCLQKSVLEASQGKSLANPFKVFKNSELNISGLFKNIERMKFMEEAINVARSLQALKPKVRRKLAGSLQVEYKKLSENLSTTEQDSFEQFIIRLQEDNPDTSLLANLLTNIRSASINASPAMAIAILDGQADTYIEDNIILGVVNLYGSIIGPMPDQDMEFIKSLAGINTAEMKTTSSDLHMSGNRIARVQIDESFLFAVKKGMQLYRKLLVANNVIELGQNVIAGKDTLFTSNSFVDENSIAGVVISNSAIYVGNHAVNKKILLYNISSTPSEKAANVVDIVDIIG
jgi:hypothetical protein